MSRFIKWSFVVVMATAFPATMLQAQAPILTLEEAIAMALENNYEIQLRKNDSTLYAINERFADMAFYPRLNASAAWINNHNNQKQKLADGSERKQNNVRSNNLQASVNLNWTLFDGLKMFVTRQKLSEYVTLGELSTKQQVLQSISDIIITYYEVVREKQQLRAIEEQMGINEERMKIAEKKLTTGLGAKPELLQAELDLNAQKAARLRQLTLIEQLKDELNLLISFKPGSIYEVSDSIPLRSDLVAGDILSEAVIGNPQLLINQQQLKISELSLKERKAERYPTLNFNSAFNFSKTNNFTVLNTFTPLYNRNAGFNYGLSMSIPILNGFNTRREIALAELEIDYQNLLLDYQHAQIETNVSKLYKDYNLQHKMLELEESNIVIAKENVYIAAERLRLGITTSLELREAQKSLEDAYNRLIAARYNAKVAETELLLLRGNILQ